MSVVIHKPFEVFTKELWDKQTRPVYLFGYGSLMFEQGLRGRGFKYKYSRKDLIETEVSGLNRGLYLVINIGGKKFKKRRLVRYFSCYEAPESSVVQGTAFKLHSFRDFKSISLNEGVYFNSMSKSVYRWADVTNYTDLKEAGLPENALVITLLSVVEYPLEKIKTVPIAPEYLKIIKEGLEKEERKKIFKQIKYDVRKSVVNYSSGLFDH